MDPSWWQVAKPVLEPSLVLLGGLLAGYVGAVLRFRRTITGHRKALVRIVAASEKRLQKDFGDLRVAFGQGLQLELGNLKEKIDAELRRMELVERDVRDVRDKSGDYTTEARFGELEQRVGRWMNEVSGTLAELKTVILYWEREARKSHPPRG